VHDEAAALARAIEAIDAANADDPHPVIWRGASRPRAQLQGELATAWLDRLRVDPPSALVIAARSHHVRRWTIPRHSYPEGRAAYLRWRRDLKDVHAAALAELLPALGVVPEVVTRAQSLVRKDGLRPGRDTNDLDAQTLEDCACLVFLQTQYEELAERITDDDHLVSVVAKTLRKMSPEAISLAGEIVVGKRGARIIARAAAGGIDPTLEAGS
jgi:hypothetical protein